MTPWIFAKKLLVLLIILSCSSFSVSRSSSAAEFEKPGLDSSDSETKPRQCLEKWITKSYFEDFGSLNDAYFQDFKERKLLPCLCKVASDTTAVKLKWTDLERRLIGEGSHRYLSTSFKIDMDKDLKLKPDSLTCEFIIIEALPSGIFADPFELQHLLERGLYSDIMVSGDTDLELPSVRSNRTVIEVHMDVGPNIEQNGARINIDIPLHVRYPPLDESGYSIVVFGEPDVFARCSNEGRLLNRTCLFTFTNDDGKRNRSTITWHIPAGVEMHAAIVSAVTFLSATLSAAFIIWASVTYSDIKFYKTLKQS